MDTSALVYYLSAALAFTTILVILLALSVYKMNKRNCQSTGNCYYLEQTACIECILHLNKRTFLFCVSQPESNVTFSATSPPNTAVSIIFYWKNTIYFKKHSNIFIFFFTGWQVSWGENWFSLAGIQFSFSCDQLRITNNLIWKSCVGSLQFCFDFGHRHINVLWICHTMLYYLWYPLNIGYIENLTIVDKC